jgi:hypothetical protein
VIQPDSGEAKNAKTRPRCANRCPGRAVLSSVAAAGLFEVLFAFLSVCVSLFGFYVGFIIAFGAEHTDAEVGQLSIPLTLSLAMLAARIQAIVSPSAESNGQLYKVIAVLTIDKRAK